MKIHFVPFKQRLAQVLWDVDPGYVHLRQGTRTLLAAIITLLLCFWPSLYTRILACFAAGLVCQGMGEAKIGTQKITFAMSTLSLLAYFSLVSYINPYPWLMAVVIICSSFAVFALRSLGPRYALFPLFVWIMGFITSILPNVNGVDFLMRLGCIALGCGISFLIYFYALPPRPLFCFFENIRYFILLLHSRSLILEQQLQQPKPFEMKEKYHLHLRRSLRIYYLQNQSLCTAFDDTDSLQKNRLSTLLSNQYLAGKAFFMLQDMLTTLAQSPLMAETNIKSALIQSLKELGVFTKNFRVNPRTFKITLIDKSLLHPKSIDTLQVLLEQSKLNVADLAPLYQFINRFNELCEHLHAFTKACAKEPAHAQ